jgi:hypothetical protein
MVGFGITVIEYLGSGKELSNKSVACVLDKIYKTCFSYLSPPLGVLDSKIKRQIQSDGSRNDVYVKDCKISMEGSQNQ